MFVKIDVTVATKFWLPCFSKFAFFFLKNRFQFYIYQWNYYITTETHEGLKRVTHMFALSDARDYSFSKVPYLEREKEIADQSNFVNNVT